MCYFGEPNYCKVEYGNFSRAEYLRALRLANKLADLRAANANPCDIRRRARFLVREFAPPYKASDAEAAEQCYEPVAHGGGVRSGVRFTF